MQHKTIGALVEAAIKAIQCDGKTKTVDELEHRAQAGTSGSNISLPNTLLIQINCDEAVISRESAEAIECIVVHLSQALPIS
jgi:hypothetical protein